MHVDRSTRCCIYPATVVGETTRKFEHVESFVIQHCQEHVAVRWYFLEYETPHDGMGEKLARSALIWRKASARKKPMLQTHGERRQR